MWDHNIWKWDHGAIAFTTSPTDWQTITHMYLHVRPQHLEMRPWGHSIYNFTNRLTGHNTCIYMWGHNVWKWDHGIICFHHGPWMVLCISVVKLGLKMDMMHWGATYCEHIPANTSKGKCLWALLGPGKQSQPRVSVYGSERALCEKRLVNIFMWNLFVYTVKRSSHEVKPACQSSPGRPLTWLYILIRLYLKNVIIQNYSYSKNKYT